LCFKWARFAFVFDPKTALKNEKQNILSHLRTKTENYRYFSREAQKRPKQNRDFCSRIRFFRLSAVVCNPKKH